MNFKIVSCLVFMGAVSVVSSFFEQKDDGAVQTGYEEMTEQNAVLLAPIENVEHIYVQEAVNTIGFTDVEVSITETEPETEPEVPVRVVECTEEDYYNLLRIVEAEATGGDVTSKMLVANVIINRVISPRFPDTITEVIFQGNGEQFQPVSDGRFYTVQITEGTVEAVERALAGENNAGGAYFFAASSHLGPYSWHCQCLTRLYEYGGHVYFTF